jgi:CheY-like chemotaxis protein
MRAQYLKFIFHYQMNTVKTKKVLLIDDDPINNLLTTRIIERHMELNVTVYDDAGAALQWLTDLPADEFPAWIFLDVNMPEMDGWDFLDELNLLPGLVRDRCKIIMLTSSIDIDDINKAGTYATVHDFISKPLTTEKLDAIAAEMHA